MPYPFSDADSLTPLEDVLNDVVEAATAAVQWGHGSLSTTGTGTPAAPVANSARVDFPTAFPPGSIVEVITSVNTGAPGNRFASAQSIDETGFTIRVSSTSGADQSVSYRWCAGVKSV